MKFFLNQVTLIGLGLIGSSIARALKEQQLARRIVGCSQSASTLEMARTLGVIDSAVSKPADSVKRSELVILCTPLSSYPDIISAISPHLKPDAILTDVGSVKKPLIDAISPLLRRGQKFIPAHPIAGSEKSGIEAGTANLFRGKKLIITPATGHHSQISCAKIVSLWESLGARTELMEAGKHDAIYASMSHAIQLLSYAYASSCTEGAGAKDAQKNEELKGFMRLSGSNPSMWQDIFAWNHGEIFKAIDSFITQFSSLITLIESQEYDMLVQKIAAASKKRSTHKDSSILEAAKRSYSSEDTVFASNVALPKMIACAAFNAFSSTDYAGSGFWGFTQNLRDISILTQKRIADHHAHILHVSQHFITTLQSLQDTLSTPYSPDFMAHLEKSNNLYSAIQ